MLTTIFRLFFFRVCAMSTGLLQGTSAPVNIPGSSLNNFSPNNHSNLFNVGDPFQLSGSAPKINNSFGPSENIFFQQRLISPGLGDTLSMSPDLRYIIHWFALLFFFCVFFLFFTYTFISQSMYIWILYKYYVSIPSSNCAYRNC